MLDTNALLPIAPVGVAIQRVLEIVNAIESKDRRKEAVYLTLSFLIALLIVRIGGDKWLILHLREGVNGVIDYLVTALVFSAGSEGANSLLKFISYKKNEIGARARTTAGMAGSDPTKLSPL